MSDDSTQTNATETPAATKEPRTRLSPRVKAFDETVGVISAMITDLESQAEGANKTTVARLTSQCEVLSDLKGRVVGMAAEGPAKPDYAGRHYIGVQADGTRVAVDSNTLPTSRSHGPESKHAFASVLGPFRTEDGVAYRISHPETDCPVVFA